IVSLGAIFWKLQSSQDSQIEVVEPIVSPTLTIEPPIDNVDHPEGGKDIQVLSQTLKLIPSKVDCAKGAEIKKNLGESTDTFWEEAENFIFYDPNDRALTVCLNGQAISGEFPKFQEGVGSEEEMVRVTEASLRDMNGDGKLEFIVYNGQCVEGPCLGSHYILQIEGKEIKIAFALHAESLKLVEGSDPQQQVFLMEKYCYTFDFGFAYSTIAMAKFHPDGSLKPFSSHEVASTYPQLIDGLKHPALADESEREKAYHEIQNLIIAAYKGTSKGEILESYDAILKALPSEENESGPDQRLHVHCETREILESI
ncbi:MAG: hypothetical protein AB7O96_08955, partial [Pseudobdellovibrionaceae bacterium]